jgi:FtsP/CotA-like multicopper oxidase with cupredoxin domain
VDGLYLRAPLDARGFELAPGNRLDVDVTFRDTSSTVHEVWDRFIAQRPNRLASIEVDGVRPGPPPAFASPARAHVPEWKDGLAEPAAATFRLNARAGGEFGIEWTINDVAFAGHDHAAAPALTLARGRFARLLFVNESARLHPMHIHGMFFRLLARNGRPADEPFFRDTVLVHPRETIDVGLVPLDAGQWMMHCHVLEHAEAGMMTTLRVTP